MTEVAHASGRGLPWPRRPRRLAMAVVSSLVDEIVSGARTVGSALPTEPALCQAFAVSRTVVREAMKELESMKLVEVRQGIGTTVRPAGEWDLLDPMVLAATVDHDEQLVVLDELVDIRRALESEMAGVAALRLTQESAARLAALLSRLHRLVDAPQEYLEADAEFHDAIMEASGCRVRQAIVRKVHADAFHRARYVGEPTTRDCEMSNIGHEAIYEAILAGDGRRASTAMADHITRAWERRRSSNYPGPHGDLEQPPAVLHRKSPSALA